MKAMKALSMPSFAPVVMVTSVLGLTSRPRKGEYASAIAFFNLGRPFIQYESAFTQAVQLEKAHLCRGILIAFDLIQSFLCGIGDVFWRIVATDPQSISGRDCLYNS